MISAVIAEFDPFHNGHKYLLDRVREHGADGIIAVMSGSFTQRGGCAMLGKYERAAAAVHGGADLVLELPQVYALGSAERFARGGVGVLSGCGCADTLCFGSECGDIAKLEYAARCSQSADISQFAEKGYSHARAVSAAVGGEAAEILSSPNNTLAVEYIKAAKGQFGLFTVSRTIERSSSGSGQFAPASQIRKMTERGQDIGDYVPESTGAIISEAIKNGSCPASLKNNERGVLSVLRRMDISELSALPDCAEGLENRLYKAIHENDSVEDIIMAVKCKRYTYARISRIIACAYLGITAGDIDKPPQYIRVLAFNDRGAAILKEMKKTAALPVIMKARDLSRLSGDARKMIDIDLRASDLFALCTPRLKGCGEDFYRGAVKI